MGRSKPKDPNYPAMPPTARLHRDWLITEKLNGTNGLIVVKDISTFTNDPEDPSTHWPVPLNFMVQGARTDGIGIWAGSKNQWLGPDGDNFGFGAWVKANADLLIDTLGEGQHRGEWWGSGIQTGYGLPKGEKRFSLFNTSRWDAEMDELNALGIGLGVVPLLAISDGHNLNRVVHAWLDELEKSGSVAAPGFMNAEGIVAFQPASQISFKATIKHDEIPKALIK
jgi:hypothetical protein